MTIYNDSITQIALENQDLVRDLANYSRESTLPVLGGLLTSPEYQSLCSRLEALVTLAVICCEGGRTTRASDACRWLNLMKESSRFHMEHTTEDVFVHLVGFEGEGYRLIGGNLENAGFHLQRLLDVAEVMPDEGKFSRWKNTLKAILTLSDRLCERCGLQRYQALSVAQVDPISVAGFPTSEVLTSRTCFSLEELKSAGIEPSWLDSLIFDVERIAELHVQGIGRSTLLTKPMVSISDRQFCIMLPTRIVFAIREFLRSACFRHSLTTTFDRELRETYLRQLCNSNLFSNVELVRIKQSGSRDTQIAHTVVRIDEGYVIAIFAILPSLETHWTELNEMTVQVEESLESTVCEVISEVSSRSEIHSGRILYITCGWRQETNLRLPNKNDVNWLLFHLSAADFDRLSYARDMDFTKLWKILDGLETIQAQGVQFVNHGGLLNFVGRVQNHSGTLIPHEQIPDTEVSLDQPLRVQLPTTPLSELRQSTCQRHDIHYVRDETGTSHKIERVHPYGQFDDTHLTRLYYSKTDWFDEQRKLTLIYDGYLQIWTTLIETESLRPNLKEDLGRMIDTRLLRVGESIDEFSTRSSIERSVCRVDIEFESPQGSANEPENPTIDELAKYCLIEYSENERSAKIVFKSGFEAGFSHPENIAEQLLARRLIKAIGHIFDLPNEDLKTLEGNIIPNKNARSFHRMGSTRFLDHVVNELPTHLFEHLDVETSSIVIGLGWRVQCRSAGNKIHGKDDSIKFLNSVVELLSNDITEGLLKFERWATIKKLMLNIERAEQDKSKITRTSASVIGLYETDGTATISSSHSLLKLGEVIGTCRVLIEIAICACPFGSGRVPAELDLTKLMARVQLLIYYGGMSDAIMVNVVEPSISISPIGQIRLNSEFNHTVLQPTFTSMSVENFLDSVPYQQKHYESTSVVKNISDYCDPTFLKLWKDDFGYELEYGVKIVKALQDLGISRNTVYLQMTEQEYMTFLKELDVPKTVAEEFLFQFSIASRTLWLIPPDGFKNTDIKPWKFGRRYAYLTRPIMRLADDQSNASEVVICPSALKRAIAHIINQANCGRLNRTFFPCPKRWDKWLDRARQGHPFTKNVAKILQEAGWNTKINTKVSEILQTKLERDYGDIDVLAWKKNKQNVLIVECKDLAEARNISEIAFVLSQYQGKTIEGQRDKLKRHLDRVNLLEDHLPMVAKFTQLKQVTIESCLIFSKVSPLIYTKIQALEGTFVGRVDDLVREFN